MELVEKLMQSLGIKEEQAKGGVGLVLKLAQEKLGAGDFAKVTEAVPGAENLIQDAPQGGGLGGAVKGLAAAFGGKAEGLGDVAELTSGFSKLGLDSGMIGKFVSIVVSFVQEKGGDDLKGLLEKVLGSKT
jgi:hypothetical protein